jgi:peptide/nickel transport system permease protein
MTRVLSTSALSLSNATRVKKPSVPIIVWVSFGWLALIVLLALLEPVLPLPKPNYSDYSATRMHPFTSWAHPLGTDELGRDILSRVIVGARVSLTVGVGSTIFAAIAGTALGACAGFFGGALDRIVGWLTDILLAFPLMIALIALTTFLGPSVWTLTLGLGIVATPLVARLARSSTMSYARRDFVLAARATGSRGIRILWREILPNIALVVSPFAITLIALSITAEGALSFLGLSVPPPQASWGNMMDEGRANLTTLPYIVVVPAVVMCLTLLSISFTADWANHMGDSRESRA